MLKLSSLPSWAKIGGGLFLSAFLVVGMFFYAQSQLEPAPANANAGNNLNLSGLQAKVGGELEYSLDKTTKRVNFVTTADRNLPITMAPSANFNSGSVADQFMAEYGGYFGLSDPSQNLVKIRDEADELGMSHVHFNQKHAGVPVFGGQVVVHLGKDLAVTSANGRLVPNINLDAKPKISKEEAADKAKEYWQQQSRSGDPEVRKSDLYVLNKGLLENKPDGNNHLVWEVDLYLEKPNEHEYYFIDAKSGDLIHQITGIQQAVDREIWDCSLGLFTGDCYLDTSWAGYTYGRSEGQLARGTNPLVGGTDTDDLYNYTGSLHNYYANKFSRNGANNQGGMGDGAANFPVATTSGLTFIDYHFLDPNDSGSCPNAFFNSANSIRFCEGYVTSDIVGHEYAHAVNFFTIQSAAGNPAGLTYRNESGALNENNSDVFGEAFEYYYEGSNNWEIGEDLSGGASRSMEDPTKYNYNFGTSTPYPDRFHSSNYYCGTQDGGGVHINSSVPNKAAYLLAIGGTFNGCTVSGIGRTKEEAIFYRAQTNYYTTSTDFNGAYNALISACGDLYGATSSDCVATRKALQAVEMDQAGACSSTARVAPICADGTTPSVSNASPAHGTKTIARDSNISFEIDDSASGIDSDSLSVTVDGRTAISGGALQSGYSGSIDSDSEGGYDVAINPGSDFDNGQSVTMVVEAEDNNGNSVLSTWSFTTININSKILTTSGPGEVTRLQAYDRRGNSTGDEVSDLFPTSYTGGAGIVPIDANSNGLKDQFLIFAASNGGPQARVMGLREDGSQYFRGQMFVFDSTIRDGLSMTTGDFDNDGYEDDVAACLTGDKAPTVRVYKDATGMDNWEKIGEFTAPFGDVGCNVGTFQYDTGAPEILVAPHHGPAEPNVYIYTAGGTLKKSFAAYGAGVTSGLTPSGIEDRIYTTPNNGSSHIMAYDRNGVRKNFWWAYAQHVRGDFKNVPGDIDLDGKDEILISPVGSNGPHVLGFEASGRQRTWPNFFAFGDETLRNGVGIAVIDNWHGVN